MKLYYAYNPITGVHIISNKFGSPNAVEEFYNSSEGKGFILAEVTVEDNNWHRFKAAIDINNNRLEQAHRIAKSGANDVAQPQEEKVVPVKRLPPVVKQVIITDELRIKMLAEIKGKKGTRVDLLSKIEALSTGIKNLTDDTSVDDRQKGLELARLESILKLTKDNINGMVQRIDYLEVQLLETPEAAAEYNRLRKEGEEGNAEEVVTELAVGMEEEKVVDAVKAELQATGNTLLAGEGNPEGVGPGGVTDEDAGLTTTGNVISEPEIESSESTNQDEPEANTSLKDRLNQLKT